MFPGVRTRRRLVERPAQFSLDDDAVRRDRALGDGPRQGRRTARGRIVVGWRYLGVRGRDRVRDLSSTNERETAVAQGARERPHPRGRGLRLVRTLYGTRGAEKKGNFSVRRPPGAAASPHRRHQKMTRSTAC